MMFAVKSLWIIYLLMQVESLMQGTYFFKEPNQTIHREVINRIPNSSSIACVLKCKRDLECMTSGVAEDGTCHLFKGEVNKQNNGGGVTLTLLKHTEVVRSDSQGILFVTNRERI